MVKTKTRGRLEVEEVTDEANQADNPIPLWVVIDIDIPYLVFASREVDIIEYLGQHLATTVKDIEDEEEEFVDDVQSESDEESPQLLD